MLIFIIFIVSISTAVFGEDVCQENPHMLCAIPPRDIPESIQELNEFCPKFKNYVDCLGNYDETCKSNERKLYVVFQHGEYDSFRNLLTDMCDEETLLHAALFENLECLKDSIQNYSNTCAVRDRMLKAFDDKQDPTLNGEDIDMMHLERQCILHFYDKACYIEYISGKCGAVAKDAAIEVIRRSYVFRGFCQLETLVELAKELETLEIDAEQKDILSETLSRFTWK